MNRRLQLILTGYSLFNMTLSITDEIHVSVTRYNISTILQLVSNVWNAQYADDKRGSQTIRPGRIRPWSFWLFICGRGLGFWGWGLSILGLGGVLGTNSHGFDKRTYQKAKPIKIGNGIRLILWKWNNYQICYFYWCLAMIGFARQDSSNTIDQQLHMLVISYPQGFCDHGDLTSLQLRSFYEIP